MRAIRSSSSVTNSTVSRRSRRIVTHQLEVATHDRDRRAQFVSGVVDEGPLHGERGRQAVQHLVETPGQAGDLVVAFDRDPPRQVGIG